MFIKELKGSGPYGCFYWTSAVQAHLLVEFLKETVLKAARNLQASLLFQLHSNSRVSLNLALLGVSQTEHKVFNHRWKTTIGGQANLPGEGVPKFWQPEPGKPFHGWLPVKPHMARASEAGPPKMRED